MPTLQSTTVAFAIAREASKMAAASYVYRNGSKAKGFGRWAWENREFSMILDDPEGAQAGESVPARRRSRDALGLPAQAARTSSRQGSNLEVETVLTVCVRRTVSFIPYSTNVVGREVHVL